MSFDNQRGKLRKIWNQNYKNEFDLKNTTIITSKGLSETKVNKYVQNLYTSEWENTELTLPSLDIWQEEWDFAPEQQPNTFNANLSAISPPPYSPSVEDIKSFNGDLTANNFWYNDDIYANAVGANVGGYNEGGTGSSSCNSIRTFDDSKWVITANTSATTFRGVGSLQRSEANASSTSIVEATASNMLIKQNTFIKTVGSFTASSSGDDLYDGETYEAFLEVSFKDSLILNSTIFSCTYIVTNKTVPGTINLLSRSVTFELSDPSNLNRNFADDVIQAYNTYDADMIRSHMDDNKITISNIKFFVRSISGINRGNLTDHTSGTVTSDISFTNNSIKFINEGESGVATFTYNLLSDEFTLPEKSIPYVNTEVISKLIDKDITSFNVKGNFEDLKTQAVIIQTEELTNGFNKYRVKATGAFFKEIEDESEIADYPQVMMFVNFIRPEDYKQVNNYNFK